MGDINRSIAWALQIAADNNHGYDQPTRDRGTDFDCSSLVCWALCEGGFDVGQYKKGDSFRTSNMLDVLTPARGWQKIAYNKSIVQPGDVLLRVSPIGHTALAISKTEQVAAHENENDGIRGGKPGDQGRGKKGEEIGITSLPNGSFEWILRPPGGPAISASSSPPSSAPPPVFVPTKLHAPGPSGLDIGQGLKNGQALVSPNRLFKFIMQTDGNAVLYDAKDGAYWATNTTMGPNRNFDFQTDGNLVIYDGQRPLWSPHTEGKGGVRLDMQNDGNLVLYRAGAAPVWATNTVRVTPFPSGPSSLSLGRGLKNGEALTSPNCLFKFIMQTDGNAVLYDVRYGAYWATYTTMGPNRNFDFQTDGNLVIYDGQRPLWSPHTEGKGGVRLDLQIDGNLVLYRADNTPVWSTNTVRCLV